MLTNETTAALPAAASAQAWLARAMAAHQKGQVDEARQAYSALLALAPEHPDGLHLLGMLEAQFGSGDDAVALISRAVALNPGEAMFHNNLGNALLQLGREVEADACYRRALELDPKRYDTLNNRALLLARRGELEAAEAAFTTLLEMAPGFGDARENMVLVCLRLKRLEDALAHCIAGLVTAPQARGLRELLGRAYVHCKMPEKACEVYRLWIADDPDDPVPRHHLDALEGRTPARASDAYVARTFDGFAGSFDEILGRLDYRAPALVGAALRTRLGVPPVPQWRVLDAGCGTGLCGEHLAPYAKSLVGVDLSRRMLEHAAQREHYQALHQEELVAFLQARPQAYDLIASADTLCYFGALEAFAWASRQALSSSGWLIFTVEAQEEAEGVPSYRLHSHGRYSHRRDYVHAVLATAGYSEVQTEAAVLRHELQEPVKGWLVCARL